ncbi:hypothetical protein KCU61_g367, partial [Aureobasidium melanogenum]
MYQHQLTLIAVKSKLFMLQPCLSFYCQGRCRTLNFISCAVSTESVPTVNPEAGKAEVKQKEITDDFREPLYTFFCPPQSQ